MRRNLLDPLVILGSLLTTGCVFPGDPRDGCGWINPVDPGGEVVVPLLTANHLMIDDFDDGGEPNLIGGCTPLFFSAAPIDIRVAPEHSFANTLRGHGASLRIEFNVEADINSFGGYIQRLMRDDACPRPDNPITGVALDLASLGHDSLTFWYKADPADVDFEVALRDTVAVQIRDEVYELRQTTPKVLAREWSIEVTLADDGCQGVFRRVAIPLTVLVTAQNGETIDLQVLKEINFGFANTRFRNGNLPLQGTVYLDEIAFVGGSQ